MLIKKSGAGKGEIDWISVKKIIVGVVMFAAGFYLLNIEAVNALLGKYINNPELLSVLPLFVAYFMQERKVDYSK